MKISEVINQSLIETIVELEKYCFGEAPWNASMIEAAIESSFRHVFALSKDRKNVGYAIMQIISGEGEIERIGVHPSYRGQSLGKYLVLEILNEQQLETCFLEVNENNQVARNLYVSCEFEEVGKRHAYYHDGADAIMMKWKRTTND